MKPKASAGRWVWMALLAWFCANLLSQSLYMGRYGLPYDAQTMLKGLGPHAARRKIGVSHGASFEAVAKLWQVFYFQFRILQVDKSAIMAQISEQGRILSALQ